MTKIDIFSGFLGAGKTTLIKKLIAEAYAGEKLVLIENEFGEIGIDGGFLREAGVTINEMNSGCICCSLVGDFGKALEQVMTEYTPDRILIEPSGVGKLSDVIRAVQGLSLEGAELGGATVVVDAKKCRMYMKNFGEFFNDQVEHASAIVLSRTGDMSEAAIAASVALLREHNPDAVIVTTPWDKLTGKQILSAAAGTNTLSAILEELMEEAHRHHHHHHDYDEECECGCHGHHDHEEHHHHHDHDEECECGCHGHHDHDEHHHHHHDHDEECECGCHGHHDHDEHHHHHHDHDEECECGCHGHHDHDEHHHHHHDHGEECSCGCHGHHHHADEVFGSFGTESARAFGEDELHSILEALDYGECGVILRAKGIVPAADGGDWFHFDYVPGEVNVRRGAPDVTGRLCVIGAGLDEDKLAKIFGV